MSHSEPQFPLPQTSAVTQMTVTHDHVCTRGHTHLASAHASAAEIDTSCSEPQGLGWACPEGSLVLALEPDSSLDTLSTLEFSVPQVPMTPAPCLQQCPTMGSRLDIPLPPGSPSRGTPDTVHSPPHSEPTHSPLLGKAGEAVEQIGQNTSC